MKKRFSFSIGCILITTFITSYSQDVIFLHHSTGAGVYDEGQVVAWINSYNTDHHKSYRITERNYPDTPYPWENYPYDYWKLWINGSCNNADADIECLASLCNSYDVIIFKHCFPGAGILANDPVPDISSSKKTLGNYKEQYRALRDLMDAYPNNKFIVWTLAPLHRLATNEQEAARAGEFVQWVRNEWLQEDEKEHPNIYIFDFFELVAEHDNAPLNGKVNCLKYGYEKSHGSNDSHPNTTANVYVGPIFAQFIVNTIESTVSTSSLPVDRLNSPIVMFRSDKLIIQSQHDAGYKDLSIYDVLGRQVYTGQLHQDISEFNLSQLPVGLYVIHLTGESCSSVMKIWKN